MLNRLLKGMLGAIGTSRQDGASNIGTTVRVRRSSSNPPQSPSSSATPAEGPNTTTSKAETPQPETQNANESNQNTTNTTPLDQGSSSRAITAGPPRHTAGRFAEAIMDNRTSAEPPIEFLGSDTTHKESIGGANPASSTHTPPPPFKRTPIQRKPVPEAQKEGNSLGDNSIPSSQRISPPSSPTQADKGKRKAPENNNQANASSSTRGLYSLGGNKTHTSLPTAKARANLLAKDPHSGSGSNAEISRNIPPEGLSTIHEESGETGDNTAFTSTQGGLKRSKAKRTSEEQAAKFREQLAVRGRQKAEKNAKQVKPNPEAYDSDASSSDVEFPQGGTNTQRGGSSLAAIGETFAREIDPRLASLEQRAKVLPESPSQEARVRQDTGKLVRKNSNESFNSQASWAEPAQGSDGGSTKPEIIEIPSTRLNFYDDPIGSDDEIATNPPLSRTPSIQSLKSNEDNGDNIILNPELIIKKLVVYDPNIKQEIIFEDNRAMQCDTFLQGCIEYFADPNQYGNSTSKFIVAIHSLKNALVSMLSEGKDDNKKIGIETGCRKTIEDATRHVLSQLGKSNSKVTKDYIDSIIDRMFIEETYSGESDSNVSEDHDALEVSFQEKLKAKLGKALAHVAQELIADASDLTPNNIARNKLYDKHIISPIMKLIVSDDVTGIEDIQNILADIITNSLKIKGDKDAVQFIVAYAKRHLHNEVAGTMTSLKETAQNWLEQEKQKNQNETSKRKKKTPLKIAWDIAKRYQQDVSDEDEESLKERMRKAEQSATEYENIMHGLTPKKEPKNYGSKGLQPTKPDFNSITQDQNNTQNPDVINPKQVNEKVANLRMQLKREIRKKQKIQRKFNQTRQEMIALQSTILEATSSVKKARKRLEEATKERDALASALVEHTKAFGDEALKIKDKLEAESNNNSKLRKQLDEVNSQLETTSADLNATLERSRSALEAREKESLQELKNLQEALDRSKVALESQKKIALDAEETARQRLNELQQAKEQLLTLLGEATQSLESTQTKLNQANEKETRLEDEKGKLESQLETAQTELATLKEQKTQTDDEQLQAKTEEVERLQTELESKKAGLAEATQMVSELREELDKVKGDLDAQSQQATRDKEAFQAELQTAEKKASDLQGQFSEATQSLKSTQTELNQANENEAQLKGEKAELESQLKTAKSELATLQIQQTQTDSEKLKAKTEKVERLQTQLESTEAELAEANREKKELQAELDTTKQALDTQSQQATRDKEALQAKLQTADADKLQADEQVSDLQGKLEDTTQSLKSTRTELNQANKRTTQLENEKGKLDYQLKEEEKRVSDLLKEQQASYDQYQNLNDIKNGLEAELRSTRKQLNTEKSKTLFTRVYDVATSFRPSMPSLPSFNLKDHIGAGMVAGMAIASTAGIFIASYMPNILWKYQK